MVDNGRQQELRALSLDWPSYDLDPIQVCDLELLLSGAFSPLEGFMGRADASSVLDRMRLADGTLWPIPITLDVGAELADGLAAGDRLALRDPEGVMLAAVTVDEVWEPDREAEAEQLFAGGAGGAANGARALLAKRPFAVAGKVEGVQLPVHYDFRELRLTPLELRRKFARLGWRRVLAFQTHQTIHRAQHNLALTMAQELGANLLIHPVVGLSGPGDADHYTRVRCYQELLNHFPKYLARLSLLPLASLGAGPREAVLQAIVHRNHGCTHFTVEPGNGGWVLETSGAPAYDPDEAVEQVSEHRSELGIEMLPRPAMGYVASEKTFVPLDKVPEGERPLTISAAEVRERLATGRELPEWFSFPGVERELRRRHPPRRRQGFTVFMTGLSGSGKSTLANALRVKLLELGGRGVALLDGDVVRKNLSSELGFSKEHRDLNILRIGFVASEITRAGGIAICAPIAPYDSVRTEVRNTVEPWGGFIMVHVATPLEVCEQRDRKGMYAKARAGIIKEFTGVSDPYEEPVDAEVKIDTSEVTPEEAVREVLLYLEHQGYISAEG
jgi:sulfate adenylyltransferase